jgi:hypothetical protein
MGWTTTEPYWVDEVPAPLQMTLADSDGTAVDLTGYTATFYWQVDGDATTLLSRASTLTDAANGVVTHTWEAADLDDPGLYVGEFHYTNGTNLFKEPGSFEVLNSISS